MIVIGRDVFGLVAAEAIRTADVLLYRVLERSITENPGDRVAVGLAGQRIGNRTGGRAFNIRPWHERSDHCRHKSVCPGLIGESPP